MIVLTAMASLLLAAPALVDNSASEPPDPPTAADPGAPEQEGREEERRDREVEKQDRADQAYDRGTEALDENQWEKAARAFDEVCRQGGRRCDGALYWKAYACNKRGRRAEAQAALAELRKSYAQSRWLGEAKALEIELQQAAGRPPSPEKQDDEELKLLALDRLMSTDAERALPLLEDLLKAGGSPRLKDRALFVLSQSDSPRATQVLVNIARGATNPDLQLKAVRYLGMSGDDGSLKLLADISAGSGDVAVRRAILQAFMQAEDKKRVFAAARAEPAAELRREAIHLLGGMEAIPELQQLYRSETDVDLRQEILNAFVAADASQALIEVAKAEKDSRLRLAAVRNLGALDADQTASVLASLYASETDIAVRRAILDAFVAQENCEALVAAARAEKDAAMKKQIVEHLSAIDCKEATDFLLEILKK